ncbi:MAG: iron complex outerrane recepter protein [Sphingomonadales bacterium]|nr:iron complex outerrane recepter protein [Sphingomonadales bacterium]
MRVTSARAALFGTVAAAALYTTPAAAQGTPASPPATTAPSEAQTQNQSAAGSDQAIVVTARRRNELLLDVPIAITAYSAEQLNRRGSLDITDIAKTMPDVTIKSSRGTNTTLTAFIRGVGQQDPVAGFEQGVGLYLDDVYLNRPQAAVLDIYDVERIEVLRGPQGTLYGRNTIGGAIKYVTARIPTDGAHLNARVNVGTHGQLDGVVSASAPLTETLRIGVAAARLSNTGFGKNLTTGQRNYNKDIWAARGTLEFAPSEHVFFRLSGDYTWDDSNARGGHRLVPNLCTVAACSASFPTSGNVFDSAGGLNDPKQLVRSGGAALRGEIELTDWLKFRTITALRKDRSTTPIDFDATPYVDLDVPAIYKNHQFSQEFQLVADKGPLQGVAGFYYLNASAFDAFDVRLYTTSAALPGLTAATVGDVKTKTWAVFGDFSYDFTPQWSVSVGGRFTNDERRAKVLRQTYIFGGQPDLGGSTPFGAGTPIATTSNFSGRRVDEAFTPRASISFKPNRDNNIYLSYSKGFKGGGFDPRGQSSQAPTQSPEDVYNFMTFKPEKVDSYELGWKAALFNRRLQLTTAVFDAEYKDVQVPGSAGCFVGGIQTFCGITTNAGGARFRGLELETNFRAGENLARQGDRFTVSGSLGYLDAKYTKFISVVTRDINGNVIPATTVDLANYRKIQNTPKWTLSGTLDYDTPLADGRLDVNTTLSYRSSSQQFELRSPGLDQPGFALWDANLVWRSSGNRYELGLHGKNLLNKKYITGGYNFLLQNPYTGAFILNGAGNPIPTLGKTGVLTAYYGNARQIFLSAAVHF